MCLAHIWEIIGRVFSCSLDGKVFPPAISYTEATSERNCGRFDERELAFGPSHNKWLAWAKTPTGLAGATGFRLVGYIFHVYRGGRTISPEKSEKGNSVGPGGESKLVLLKGTASSRSGCFNYHAPKKLLKTTPSSNSYGYIAQLLFNYCNRLLHFKFSFLLSGTF